MCYHLAVNIHCLLASQSVEFEINKEFVGRIVGSHGAAVNKLRDTLGVKVDFSDEVEDREKEVGKKKKAAPKANGKKPAKGGKQ